MTEIIALIPWWVWLPLAVVVAIMALWFAAQSMDDDIASAGDMVSGSILMGLGIASMHYTAMFAASFKPADQMIGNTAFAAELSGVWVGALILGTLIILGTALRFGRAISSTRALPSASGQGGN